MIAHFALSEWNKSKIKSIQIQLIAALPSS